MRTTSAHRTALRGISACAEEPRPDAVLVTIIEGTRCAAGSLGRYGTGLSAQYAPNRPISAAYNSIPFHNAWILMFSFAACWLLS